MCHICKNTIIIRDAEGKENAFCILHMLRIHHGLQKLGKRNLSKLHLKTLNQFDIRVPCIKITNSELLFEKYRMDLN